MGISEDQTSWTGIVKYSKGQSYRSIWRYNLKRWSMTPPNWYIHLYPKVTSYFLPAPNMHQVAVSRLGVLGVSKSKHIKTISPQNETCHPRNVMLNIKHEKTCSCFPGRVSIPLSCGPPGSGLRMEAGWYACWEVPLPFYWANEDKPPDFWGFPWVAFLGEYKSSLYVRHFQKVLLGCQDLCEGLSGGVVSRSEGPAWPSIWMLNPRISWPVWVPKVFITLVYIYIHTYIYQACLFPRVQIFLFSVLRWWFPVSKLMWGSRVSWVIWVQDDIMKDVDPGEYGATRSALVHHRQGVFIEVKGW